MNAGDPRKYDGLLTSKTSIFLLKNDPEQFKKYCNGVGSMVGFWGKLTYHFIPNTIWFLDITPSSDLHDVDFSYPNEFRNIYEARIAFDEANLRFYEN